MDEHECYFCESTEDRILPSIGIAMGMAGNDYAFCGKCLRDLTAEQFWGKLFESLGYEWPPSLKAKK